MPGANFVQIQAQGLQPLGFLIFAAQGPYLICP